MVIHRILISLIPLLLVAALLLSALALPGCTESTDSASEAEKIDAGVSATIEAQRVEASISATLEAMATPPATPTALAELATPTSTSVQSTEAPAPTPTATPTSTRVQATKVPAPGPTPISATVLFHLAGDGNTFSDPSLIGTPVVFSGKAQEVRSRNGVNSVYILAGIRGSTALLIVCESGSDQTAAISQVQSGEKRTFSGRIAEGHLGYPHLVYISNCRLKNQ